MVKSKKPDLKECLMTERSYPACLRELYESEILGERVFQLLSDACVMPQPSIGSG